MDNQSILDNAPLGVSTDLVDITGNYFDEHCNHLNSEGFWSEQDTCPIGPRTLADIERIVQLERELIKYKNLYNLAVAIEQPKKQTKMLMGDAANKTIRQQFEEHRPFIEECAREGMTMAAIAKRLDVTPIRLANAFKSLGLSINRLRSEGARL